MEEEEKRRKMPERCLEREGARKQNSTCAGTDKSFQCHSAWEVKPPGKKQQLSEARLSEASRSSATVSYVSYASR